MELWEVKEGFKFDNTLRNMMLSKLTGLSLPKMKKTGTTIVGICFKDGVVLGADTRATEGSIVCDKNCQKIHYITSNIFCCGAGTAADTENATALISSQLELHRMETGRTPRVTTAATLLTSMLFKYQGHISAALVLGGVDDLGHHIYMIHPHGSSNKLPFATMGSGSLAAMAVLERGYRDNMTKEEAMQLVRDAVAAGIFNDLGSGSNIDITVITKDGPEIFRNYERPNERLYRPSKIYTFKTGTTVILDEQIIEFDEENKDVMEIVK